MIHIDGHDIELTRGDSLLMRLSFLGRELPQGTQLLITLKKRLRDEIPVLEKLGEIEGQGAVVTLEPEETNLTPGVYYWDARLLIPQVGGGSEVRTPMEAATFVILDAVGDA